MACVTTVLLLASVILLAGGAPVRVSAAARPAPGGVLGLGSERSAPPVSYRGSEKIGPHEQPAGAEHAAMRAVAQRTAAPVARLTVKAAVKPAPRAAKGPGRGGGSRTSASGWRTARVSWYGPGFYGNRTASGSILRPGSMVVAHRSLPFGTKIEFEYDGRRCVAVVADRGPSIASREFDLGPGTAKALGFGGVGTVRYRFVK